MPTFPQFLKRFALATPLFLPIGCDDGHDNPGTGPAAHVKVRAVVDGGGGVVSVSEAGIPVTTATVELNGIAAVPTSTEGRYEVSLPAAVMPGGAMALSVRSGDVAVRGSGNLPEAPVVTAPAGGSSFDPADLLVVAWSSASNPGRFAVEAVGPGTARSLATTEGSDRERTVSLGTVSRGTWAIQVRAISTGTLTGDLEAGSSMEIGAAAASAPAITVEPHLLILGEELGPEVQRLRLTLDARAVDGATVTVNGEPASQAGPGEPYVADLGATLAAGSPLLLSVLAGPGHYTAAGSVPERPANATASGVYRRSAPILVRWTSDSDPDRFGISVREWDVLTPFLLSRTDIPGNARSFAIPARALPLGEYFVTVSAFEDGTFSGPAHPGSRMAIRNPGTGTVWIEVAP